MGVWAPGVFELVEIHDQQIGGGGEEEDGMK